MHDDLRKSAKDDTLEHSLFAAFNTAIDIWQQRVVCCLGRHRSVDVSALACYFNAQRRHTFSRVTSCVSVCVDMYQLTGQLTGLPCATNCNYQLQCMIVTPV